MISIAYPWVLVVGLFGIVAVALYVRYYKTSYSYFFPAARLAQGSTRISIFEILRIVRSIFFGALVIALARPRTEQARSYSKMQGVDIMMVLDVSGSMELFDDLKDKRTRLQVATKEALSFIEKRHQDALGLVLFGAVALSRCPVTFDKKLLSQIVRDVKIGTINPDGTMLAGALMLAAKKLEQTTGTSKIIIMLTDGAPSPHDIDPMQALAYVRDRHIKVYTIGVGSQEGGYMDHPWYGTVSVATPLNKELLERIAVQTGGVFFHAKKPEELARIYAIIDDLEKHDRDIPVHVTYHEYFIYFLWIAVMCLLIELCSAWYCAWL